MLEPVERLKHLESRAFNCRILYGLYLPTVILIIIGIPSPTHSFIPGLKPSFSANPSVADSLGGGGPPPPYWP